MWIGDGSNFPGQVNFAKAFERYLDAMREIYAALPDDWRLFTEHKMYEPAFYSTVVQDWGTNYIIARNSGDKAYCLVDLGHHAPNVNIEMIVVAADPVQASSAASISTIRNMATTTSTPARSIPTGCSSSSTNWSMPSCTAPRVSIRRTCSTRATTSPTRSRA